MLEILNDADYELFRKIIYDESGITFSATNRSILDSRIKELLRKKNIATPQEYYAIITKNPDDPLELILYTSPALAEYIGEPRPPTNISTPVCILPQR